MFCILGGKYEGQIWPKRRLCAAMEGRSRRDLDVSLEAILRRDLAKVHPLSLDMRVLMSKMGPFGSPPTFCATCAAAGEFDGCAKHERRLWRYQKMRETDKLRRAKFIKDFASSAFPSVPAIESISNALRKEGIRVILSVGSGAGLWERLLELKGLEVKATDASPPERKWLACEKATSVEAVTAFPAPCLMCVWPHFLESCLRDCLDVFDGDYVLYVGEGEDGCTDDGSVQVLRRSGEWDEVMRANGDTYYGLYDDAFLYRRATRPIFVVD